MKSGLVVSWLATFLLTSPGRGRRGRQLYTDCHRATCQPATDRETQFEFDQPAELYLDQELATKLHQSHRQAGLV